jgi:hypothetical protein
VLLRFRDGEIMSARDYLDTQHAHDAWSAPLPESEIQRAQRLAGQVDDEPLRHRAHCGRNGQHGRSLYSL